MSFPLSNRLSAETSPYLLQHADNPVHWQPWDEQTLTLARRKPADPAVDRLFGLPLVPCHGARILRGRGGGGGDEPPVREHQGRPRGAPRPRPDLPDRPPDADPAQRRLAADHVPGTRRHALLRRHLFSQRTRATACPVSPTSASASRKPTATARETSPPRPPKCAKALADTVPEPAATAAGDLRCRAPGNRRSAAGAVSTAATAASAVRRSFRIRPTSPSCCAAGSRIARHGADHAASA
jgi:hypothetical protein